MVYSFWPVGYATYIRAPLQCAGGAVLTGHDIRYVFVAQLRIAHCKLTSHCALVSDP